MLGVGRSCNFVVIIFVVVVVFCCCSRSSSLSIVYISYMFFFYFLFSFKWNIYTAISRHLSLFLSIHSFIKYKHLNCIAQSSRKGMSDAWECTS